MGPTCRQGNTAILTYDYVHRTHWEVFGFQYPPILKNWWCDDWITRVYEDGRMTRLPALVRHRVDIQPTRYEVDQRHEQALVGELARGRAALGAWLRKHAAPGVA